MEYDKKLCPGCKVGFEQYILDKHSPECPYLSAHNGNSCPFYKKLEKEKINTTNLS